MGREEIAVICPGVVREVVTQLGSPDVQSTLEASVRIED